MLNRLPWLVAGVGAAAALAARAWRRRGAATAAGTGPAEVDPRAEELRRKLAESRVLVGEREVLQGAEISIDATEALEGEADERRRRVHDEGRAAAERMRGTTSSSAD